MVFVPLLTVALCSSERDKEQQERRGRQGDRGSAAVVTQEVGQQRTGSSRRAPRGHP